ncbi:MAG TPA: hypothetical protein DEH27_09030 [Deltaproteobacteria bacterium]|nr:hypothetical protein [Deltaproteobacteria bacterium]
MPAEALSRAVVLLSGFGSHVIILFPLSVGTRSFFAPDARRFAPGAPLVQAGRPEGVSRGTAGALTRRPFLR